MGVSTKIAQWTSANDHQQLKFRDFLCIFQLCAVWREQQKNYNQLLLVMNCSLHLITSLYCDIIIDTCIALETNTDI